MPFTELYTALETGAIDGQENPAPSILMAKLNEVQDYLTLTNHTYNPQIVIMSAKLWDKLNEDERKLLQEATLEARDYQRAVSREQAARPSKSSRPRGWRSANCQRTRSRSSARSEPVADQYAAQLDPTLVQQLQGQLAELRGKN